MQDPKASQLPTELLQELEGFDSNQAAEPAFFRSRKNGSEIPPFHVDERWLISYSDMMTLLFGFFVIMYSFSMENSGQGLEERVKEMAEATKTTPSAPPVENPEEKVETDVNVQELIAKMNALEEKLKNVIEEGSALAEEKAQLLAEIEQLKKEFEVFSDRIKSSESMQAKLDDLKFEMQQKEAQLQQAIENKTQQQTQVASINADRQQIEQKFEGLQADMGGIQEKLAQTKKENTKLKAENKDLNEKLNAMQVGGDKPDKFMFILTRWTTKDHDLDLVVTDPLGATYDYRKRKDKEENGEFLVDTRRGPGIEMWRANHLIPGNYRVSVQFYNQYGNKADTQPELSILTNKGRFEVPPFKLDFAKKRMAEFEISLKEDGQVSVQNLSK